MRRALVAALGLFLAASAALAQFDEPPSPYALYRQFGPWLATQIFNLGFTVPGILYDPRYYGCTWDNAHDVGPCINSAAAAAGAAGGGTVVLPAGNYGVATQIAIKANGVSLVGVGVGNARDSSAPNVFTAVTELTWIGTPAATEFIVSPPSTVSLYAVNVTGIVFNCAAVANICAEFEQVSNSTINIGVSEPRSVGALFTTEPSGFTDGPGNQNDDIWVQSRSTSATYSPTGILFDSGAGSTWNTSYNRIHQAFAWYAKGDGIVFGNSDNNIVINITAQQDPTNQGGTPVVWANSAYVMKNGVAVNGPTRDNLVLKTSVAGVVQGYQTGSTITAGSNSGTAAVTTVTLPTTSPTPANNGTLIFSGGTTGVLFGMVANCGGYYCGLAPNTPVFSTTGTTVTLADVNVGTVASSTNVIFSYGITNFAAPGTYVMTAADATHWSLTTVPAGGHAQTDIAVANGAITFTDMVIPLSGTPVAGDTFTIVVPQFQAIDNTFENLDKGNASPDPMVEPGAATFFNDTNNPFFTLLSGLGNIFSVSRNCSQCSINIGGTANTVASTAYSGGDFAGTGNNVQGFGGVAVGGANNLQQGTYGFVHGFSNLQSGSYGGSGGYECTDRGHYAADCRASGAFAVQGDAQTEMMVLRGSGASTSAFGLTADGTGTNANSPNPNCINIPNNTAYSITVTLMALDHTTVSKNETWLNWGGLLTRGANAASTALTMQSTPTPLSNGTVTGSAVAASADTTNGCLTLQFTPPTGNSDTWNVAARVTTVEVQ